MTKWLSFAEETEALKMFAWMQQLGYTMAMYDAEASFIKSNTPETISGFALSDGAPFDYEAFQVIANRCLEEGAIHKTTALDSKAPYFVAWTDDHDVHTGKVLIDYEEAFKEWRYVSNMFPHSLYDNTGRRLKEIGNLEAAKWANIDQYARQQLEPF